MHGDYLNSEGRRIRDAIFEMSSYVSMHRAIAIALENVKFGQMEAGAIESIAKEFRVPNPQDQRAASAPPASSCSTAGDV